jgi:hypothetical protein
MSGSERYPWVASGSWRVSLACRAKPVVKASIARTRTPASCAQGNILWPTSRVRTQRWAPLWHSLTITRAERLKPSHTSCSGLRKLAGASEIMSTTVGLPRSVLEIDKHW